MCVCVNVFQPSGCLVCCQYVVLNGNSRFWASTETLCAEQRREEGNKILSALLFKNMFFDFFVFFFRFISLPIFLN